MSTSYAVRQVQAQYPHANADYIRWRLRYSTFVNFERQYLYYEVAKAASTSMKMLIHALEKLPPIAPYISGHSEVRRDMFIHERNAFQLKSLIDFDDQAQEYILTSPNFLRFTVVRNPYTRLQSAWKDKVLPCAPGYQYLYYQIKGRLPRSNDPRSFITFPEFITAIAKDDLRVCNAHWRSQVEHLFFKSMNLNLIGRTESLSETVKLFIKRAAFAATQIPAATNTSIANVPYDQTLADQVYTLYARDFVDLNYAKNSWKSKDQTPVPETVQAAKFLDEITERNIVIGHLYKERTSLRERVQLLQAKDNTDAATRYSKRLAIIVPYRDRAEHLAKFVPHVVSYFQRDKLDRQIPISIHVIEQNGNAAFNLGRIRNCGYMLTRDNADYFCFHAVDYLPVWTDYSWSAKPVHLAWYGLTRQENPGDLFGGVLLFDKVAFERINGYPNVYWGWAGEDFEVGRRCQLAGLGFEKRDGTYISLPHPPRGFLAPGVFAEEARRNRVIFEKRRDRLAEVIHTDGLSNLKFDLMGKRPLTLNEQPLPGSFHYVVDIGQPEALESELPVPNSGAASQV
jgi:hypothetical protein